MKNKALALLVGASLASAGAFADETVVEAAEVASVVETAKLDTAAADASSEGMFGLSSSTTTGLIFGAVALTTFVVLTDGDAQGAPSTPGQH